MHPLTERLHTLNEWLWGHARTQAGERLQWALRLTVCTVREIQRGDLTLRAMSLVYTTLLALVPVLALSFSLFKALGIHNQMEPMLLNVLQPLGDEAPRVVGTLLGFVDNIKIGVLGSIGVAMLFYTVLSTIQKVEASFNHTWRIPRTRPLGQRISQYLVALLLGPLALSLVVGITASLSSTRVVTGLLDLPGINEGAVLFGRLVPLLMITGVFTLMFAFIPNTRVRWLPAATGGLVSGVLWQAAAWAFAAFVASSGNYNAVYSGFAILIVLLIWLYIAWLILLVGCQISFLVQNPDYMRRERQALELSPIEREALIMDVLAIIGHRFLKAQSPITAETLISELRAAPEQIINVVDLLQTAGLVTENTQAELLLTRAPESMALRSLPTGNARKHQRAIKNPAVQALHAKLDTARCETFGQTTVRDLIADTAND